MKKKTSIVIVVLVVLIVVGGAFYLFKTGKIQIPQFSSNNEKEFLPASSTEESAQQPTLPGVEAESTSSETSIANPSVSASGSLQRQMTLEKIEAQVDEIKNEVDVLTLKVEQYTLETKIKEAKIVLIQQQINDVSGQVSVLKGDISEFVKANGGLLPQVAGATQEMPFTGGPTPP